MKRRSFCLFTVLFLIVTLSPSCRAETDEPQASYAEARSLLYSRQFEQAYLAFSALGDYRDSALQAAFAQRYPETEPVFDDCLLEPWYVSKPFEHGTLYQHAGLAGVFYVPEEVTDETHFVLYYCGGAEGEDYLYYPGVYSYFDTFFPNAVIFFCNESGYGHIREKNARMYRELQHIAHDLGTVVHDLSTIGSSCGCYTALKAAAQYYEDCGLPVLNVCTLDTGMDWVDDAHNLTAEECGSLREAGTVLYLFEQPEVGLEVPQLRLFAEQGVETWSIGCTPEQHSLISVYAYINGVFSFCAGEEIVLPEACYSFVRLYP